MTATILNFKKTRNPRPGELQGSPHTSPTATAGPVPKDALFETGTFINLSSVVHLEDTDAVGCRDAEAEADVRAVFARYGLELDLYTISFVGVVSAAAALDWAASEIGVTYSESKKGRHQSSANMPLRSATRTLLRRSAWSVPPACLTA